MSWDNKVNWWEGMFVGPQHFQQADRYVEKLVRDRAAPLHPFGWGLSKLKFDTELLKEGKLAVVAAQGVLPDGTPFSIPDDADPPAPFDPESSTEPKVTVCLALPVRMKHAVEADRDDGREPAARYAVKEATVKDTDSRAPTEIAMNISRQRFQLLAKGRACDSYSCIPIARIGTIGSKREIILDDNYIPTVVDCQVSVQLDGFLHEIRSRLAERGETLNDLVSDIGAVRAAGVDKLLQLQLINRYEPIFTHFTEYRSVHPETFYAIAVQLAGELSTFFSKTRRPSAVPAYDHLDLAASFGPLMAVIRRFLAAETEESAIRIELKSLEHGVYVGEINDKTLLKADKAPLGNARFILTVRAKTGRTPLRDSFPKLAKVGPYERIRELVTSQLPGIDLFWVSNVPSELTYREGLTYFELDRTSELWPVLSQRSGRLVIHVPAEFTDVEMQLWAIRAL
jgi:type VI secretion system protein ImpJ